MKDETKKNAASADLNSSYPNAATETPADIVADDVADTLALSTDFFGKINLARDIAGGGKGYCTMTAEDNRAKATLYNACANPEKLSAKINEPIEMTHFYVEVIQCANENSGELVNVPRVVIIDKYGKGYQAVSVGIYNAVKRIVSMFGNPAQWDTPLTVKCQNVDLGGGQHTYNLVIVPPEK